MLVLTRKAGQKVTIGEVVLEVLEVRGHQVRLGVTAPKEVPVWRQELLPLKEEQKPQGDATNG